MPSSNRVQTVRLADSSSCQSDYAPVDGQVHLADYRTRASFYFQPVVRPASPQRSQLQHRVSAPYPPLRSPSRPLHHHRDSGPLHPETQNPHGGPHNFPAKHLQTHPNPHRRSLRRRRLFMGKSLPLQQHSLACHPPHQALLPQRCPRRPAIRLPGQQPQHIPLLFPRGRGLGVEDWCQTRTVERLGWR